MERVVVSLSVAAFAGLLVFAVIRATAPAFVGKRGWAGFKDYDQMGWSSLWISPALILVGASEVKSTNLSTAPWWALLLLALGAGLLVAITDHPKLRVYRDSMLSVASTVIAVLLAYQYLTRDQGGTGQVIVSGASLTFFYIAFALGLMLNIRQVYNLPLLGVAFLGALEVLLFLAYPFEIDLITQVQVQTFLLVNVLAVLVGVAAAAAPRFLLLIAGVAICVADVALNVVLWWSSEGSVVFDWTALLLISGIAVGVGALAKIRRPSAR